MHSIAWLGQRGLGGAQGCVKRDKMGLGIGAQEKVSCANCAVELKCGIQRRSLKWEELPPLQVHLAIG